MTSNKTDYLFSSYCCFAFMPCQTATKALIFVIVVVVVFNLDTKTTTCE